MPDAVCVTASAEELQEWVREHRVTWETRSRREAVQGQDGTPELELTLLGRDADGRFPVGDEGYLLVYERLRAIALHVLESIPGARHRLDPFDAAVRLRPEQDWAPEVELTLVVVDADHDAPDTGHEQPLLARLESGLAELGAQRKHWREP